MNGSNALFGSLQFNNTLLKLECNKEKIPDELQGKSISEIRKYYLDLSRGKTNSKQVKLMIVGQEGHGKTSLLNYLKENKNVLNKKTETTDGIEIKNWKIKGRKSEEEEEITISTWDFAGQKVVILNN